jgi:hypothetical protein
VLNIECPFVYLHEQLCPFRSLDHTCGVGQSASQMAVLVPQCLRVRTGTGDDLNNRYKKECNLLTGLGGEEHR